ncbi:MAG: hypothetical protein ACEY3D_09515 [Rickettsia sp.]|uniref:hypothetical protein n=1 Tax=Rickettsia sp. TaxID=789 RepID=UPI00397A87B8
MLEGRTPSHIAVLKGQTEHITDLIKGGVNQININDNNITIAEEPKPLFGQFKSACHEKHFDKHTVIHKLLLPNYESFFNELGITRHIKGVGKREPNRSNF